MHQILANKFILCEAKGKLHPRTGLEGPEEE
jgi:hypothetical protein